MFLQRTVASLIPLLLFATSTCGFGCDLRCSLGELPFGGAKAAVSDAGHAKESREMSMADLARPSGPCHHKAETRKPRPAAPGRCTHPNTPTLCPHVSCSSALALAPQSKNAKIYYLAFEVLSACWLMNAVDRVQAGMEKSGFFRRLPPLASLRI